MYFGEKLRRLRQERNWTQPDLAEMLKVEQSWLSKIENDKSIPSSELLEKIADSFAISLPELLDGLDPDYIAGSLASIPEVRGMLQQQKYKVIHNAKSWIFAATTSLALGYSLLLAGGGGFFFSDTLYLYESEGLVYFSEPENLFHERDNIIESMAYTINSEVSTDELMRGPEAVEYILTKKLEIAKREGYRQIVSSRYLGRFFQEGESTSQQAIDIFGENVAAGSPASRSYFEVGTREIRNLANSILIVLGIFLIIAGFGLFFGEFRISRIARK